MFSHGLTNISVKNVIKNVDGDKQLSKPSVNLELSLTVDSDADRALWLQMICSNCLHTVLAYVYVHNHTDVGEWMYESTSMPITCHRRYLR